MIRDILIPIFAPELRGRLRTYSAGGASKLEPSVDDFQRLVVFVHLQPVYRDRLWIRADGDVAGTEAITKIRAAFPNLSESSLSTFSKEQFEYYYPQVFADRVAAVLAIENKHDRRKQKAELLQEVLDWTEANKDDARAAWETSAQEPITLLQSIRTKLLIAQ